MKTRAQSPGGEFPVEDLLARLEHFLVENEQVVPRAGAVLAAGDMAGFARVVHQSQAAAEELLGNQVPKRGALAADAREVGALGGLGLRRRFRRQRVGPGRRGRGRRGEFLREWRLAYERAHPEAAARAVFFETSPGPAALRIG